MVHFIIIILENLLWRGSLRSCAPEQERLARNLCSGIVCILGVWGLIYFLPGERVSRASAAIAGCFVGMGPLWLLHLGYQSLLCSRIWLPEGSFTPYPENSPVTSFAKFLSQAGFQEDCNLHWDNYSHPSLRSIGVMDISLVLRTVMCPVLSNISTL